MGYCSGHISENHVFGTHDIYSDLRIYSIHTEYIFAKLFCPLHLFNPAHNIQIMSYLTMIINYKVQYYEDYWSVLVANTFFLALLK